jgi:hypothetical protein
MTHTELFTLVLVGIGFTSGLLAVRYHAQRAVAEEVRATVDAAVVEVAAERDRAIATGAKLRYQVDALSRRCEQLERTAALALTVSVGARAGTRARQVLMAERFAALGGRPSEHTAPLQLMSANAVAEGWE